MDRFKLKFLSLQAKSLARQIPLIVASLLLFAALASAAFASMGNDKSDIFFNIGTVLPEDDPMINMGYSLLTGMESLKDYCSFVRTDVETAKQMLRDGELYGVVVIPEHFIEDVLSGRNTPAKLILPDSPGIEVSLLRSVVNAGSSTLAYAQSGVYALSDALYTFGKGNGYDDAIAEINNDYVKFVINRGSIFDAETMHAADGISTSKYFVCSAIIAIVLLVFMTSGSYILLESPALVMQLGARGIKPWMLHACKLLCMTLVYGTVFAAIYLASSFLGVTVNGAGFASIYLVSLLASAFSMLIFSRMGSMTFGILTMFVAALTMMFISGAIVPMAYLPKSFEIFRFLPTGYMHRLMQAVFSGHISAADVLGAMIYSALFTALSGKAKP